MPEPQVQRQAEEGEEELLQPKLAANTEYSIQRQIDEEEEKEEDLIQTKLLVDQITPWSKDRLKRKSFRISDRRIQPLKLLIILNHRSSDSGQRPTFAGICAYIY
ncbi:MAG: hypothetical protein C5617_005210 [ANME-2 cluster archaeon]|jgi:hypothetical protein|nr:MAG: hypothetical protein C5617_005210 [ANME-2 cluster archaeon]